MDTKTADALRGAERFITSFHQGHFGAHEYDSVKLAGEHLAAIRTALADGPECGHSACRQNWIDTSETACVKTRIVVNISGGVLNGVYCSDENVEVTLVDFDDLEADGVCAGEMDEVLEAATAGLSPVY